MLNENALAPDFCLPGHDGQEYCLSHFRNKYVILYFYPKDNTPGCTQEACDFRDNLGSLNQKECVVFGISRDSIASHQKFQTKFNLNFILLSDPDLKVHQAYEVLESEKTIRATFLIDKSGKLAKVWPKVKVNGHVKAIIDTLASPQ